jgi:hypothetical protein
MSYACSANGAHLHGPTRFELIILHLWMQTQWQNHLIGNTKLLCMVLIVVYVYMIDFIGQWPWAVSFSLEIGKLLFVCS